MKHNLFTSALLVCIVACTGMLPLACDGDDPAPTGPGVPLPPPGGTVTGRVHVLFDGSGIEGAKVALIRVLPYKVVGSVAETDTSGDFLIREVPPGDYYIFIYPREYLAFDAMKVLVTVGKGETVSRDIGLLRSDLWSDRPPLATGVVRDAGTGAPIEGAFVCSSPGFFTYGWLGITLPIEDVTDAEGRYAVQVQEFWPSQRGALVVSKEGYDVFYVDSLVVADTTTYDVGLTTGGPTGSISGRIIGPDSVGVGGLPVALSRGALWDLSRSGRYKGWEDPDLASVLGKSVLTNSDGSFTIEGLAPGEYYVNTGYLPDDGYGLWGDLVAVVEGEVTDIEIMALPVFGPVSPEPGATTGVRPTLEWESVPGAIEYRVHYGNRHMLNSATVTGTDWQFPADIPVGTHVRWGVDARFGPGERSREFDVLVTFTVAE